MSVVRPCRAGVSRGEVVILLAAVVVVLGLGAVGCRKAQQTEKEAESKDNVRGLGEAKTSSADNLKRLSLSIHDCGRAHDHGAPPVYGYFPGRQPGQGPQQERQSIFFHLLPYLEQQNVYNSVKLDAPIKTFIAPTDPTNGPDKPLTSYAANERLFRRSDGGLTMPHMFYTRGSQATIAFVERYAARNGPWASKDCVIDQNAGLDFDLKPPGKEGNVAHAFVSQGCLVGLADGSVKTFAPGTKDDVFRWGLDPQRNEPAPAGW
jgi:hypothetical protein